MNYTRVLSFVPYPYKFTIQSNIYANQVYGSSLASNSQNSIEWIFGTKYKKSFYTMYYSLSLPKLLLKHFIWSRLSDLMIRIGLVSTKTPKSSVAQSIINDQLRLLKIRYEIEIKTEEREKYVQLFTNISEEEEEDEEQESEFSPEDIQSILDNLGDQLSKLNEEKAIIKERIKQKRQTTNKKTNKNQTETEENENKKFIISDQLAEWGIGILSNILTETIVYPLQLVEIWMYIQQQDCSIFQSSSYLLNSFFYQNKHRYDGFLMHCFASVSQGILVYPCMKILKNLIHIPDEQQLQKSMRVLLSLFSSEDPFECEDDDDDQYEWTNSEKKREIVKSFRDVMKNTFAFTLSNWFSQCLVYPLFTCRTILAAQGSSYLAPLKFNSTFSVFKYLNRKGFSSYYSGFSLQLFSVCNFSILFLIIIYSHSFFFRLFLN